MSAPKFDPRVYAALRATYPELSNRDIARLLGVNEASVRRALARPELQARPRARRLLTELADVLEGAGL